MKKTLKDLYGSWILFFHYVKWPIFLGLPVLYLELDYKRNIIMDILWIYCFYLVIESFYKMYKYHGTKTSCSGSCSRK